MANQYSETMPLLPQEIEDRRALVVKLRRYARHWDDVISEVEKEFGIRYSRQVLYDDFKQAMAVRARDFADDADAARIIMIEQIDMLIEKHLALGSEGSVDSADTVIKLLTRKSKLLGTDAPEKKEIDDRRDTRRLPPIEVLKRLDAVRARLQAQLGPPPEVIDVTPIDKQNGVQEHQDVLSPAQPEQSSDDTPLIAPQS